MHFFASASETRLLPSGLDRRLRIQHAAAERGAVVFTINGDNQLPEQTLDHWEGYRRVDAPVRIGMTPFRSSKRTSTAKLMDASLLVHKYVVPLYDGLGEDP